MKQPRLISLKIENIKLFENNIFEVSFCNEQKVYIDQDDENMYKITSGVYTPRITSIVGINATGKSTTLNMIYWAMGVYFCNLDLPKKKNKLDHIFTRKMIVTLLYVVGKKAFHIRSTIVLDESLGRYVFDDETISYRNITNSTSLANFFDTDSYKVFQKRSNLDNKEKTFLESSKSIARLTIDSDDKSTIIDLRHSESIGISPLYSDEIDPSIYKYLDSSIEYIKPFNIESKSESLIEKLTEELTEPKLYTVKFIGRDELKLDYKELNSVLSSGTVRGVQVLLAMRTVFARGGYILVDEIENHFNKSIVMDIFKLFRSKEINPKAAMLIFSTHYTELIDDFERNDMINITSKTKDSSELKVTNLSIVLKRGDYKKSEIYFGDLFNLGTAVNYSNYLDLLDSFKNQLRENESVSDYANSEGD